MVQTVVGAELRSAPLKEDSKLWEVERPRQTTLSYKIYYQELKTLGH